MKSQSWTNVVLGLWLIGAPFVLAYAGVTTAVYEDVILGIGIALLALWRALGEETPSMAGVSWLVAAGGLWVVIAPFIVGDREASAAVANDVTVGIVVACLAAWRALAQLQSLPMNALEREMGQASARLGTVEPQEARHVVEVEVEAIEIEAEVAPIEAVAAARQAEAEVKAAATRLEATTPHYPRA